jgi:hypothetical protein
VNDEGGRMNDELGRLRDGVSLSVLMRGEVRVKA